MTTIVSAQNGVWSDTASWSPAQVPISGDDVTITHEITVDVTDAAAGTGATASINNSTPSSSTATFKVKDGGKLIFSRSVNSKLTVRGDLLIMAVGTAANQKGTLDMGTIASPIPQGVTAELVLNGQGTSGEAGTGLRVMYGAISHMHGVVRKRVARLVGDALATATTIYVDDATGWQPGDQIFLGPTEFSSATATRAELVTIHASYTPGSTTVTLTAGLTYPHDDDVGVVNCTSNVKISSANATYQGSIYQQWGTNNNAGERTANHVLLSDLGYNSAASEDRKGAWYMVTLNPAYNTPETWNDIDGMVVYASNGNGNSLYTLGNAKRVKVKNSASIRTATGGTGAALYVGNTGIFDFEDCLFYGVQVALSTGFSEGIRGSRFYRCDLCCGNAREAIAGYGQAPYFEDCRFYGRGYLALNSSMPGAVFKGCDIGYTFPLFTTTSGGGATNLASTGFESLVQYQLNECMVGANLTLPPYTVGANNWDDAQPLSFLRVKNKNNDASLQELFVAAGVILRDNATYKRSSSSLNLRPMVASREHSRELTVQAPNGVEVTVVGYVRFDSNWGTGAPPTVTLSGLGITPQVFTPTDTVDTWHKFTLTATQTSGYDGFLTMTFAGSTANAAGSTGTFCNAWLSGCVDTEFVTTTRHYGYLYDGLTYRTVDPSVSETDEAVVAAYTGIETLDKLYDSLMLALADDFSLPVFMRASGLTLDLGTYDLVLDSAASSVVDITGGTATVKSSALASGPKFTSVQTSGDITLTGETASCGFVVDGGLIVADIDDVTGSIILRNGATLSIGAKGTAPAGAAEAGTTVLVTGAAAPGDVFDFRLFVFNAASTFENQSGTNIILQLSPGQQAPTLLETSGTITMVDTVVVTVAAPNLLDGSRARLYNVTQDTELDNVVVAGGLGYSFVMTSGTHFDAGDAIVLLATYQSGGIAKQVWRGSGTATSADITFTDAQTAWAEPTTLGIDGSTVTECATDFVEIQVEVDDPNDATSKDRIAAFIVDAITSEDGIRAWVSLAGVPAIRFPSAASAVIDVSVVAVTIINVKAASKLYVEDDFSLEWSDGLQRADAVLGSSIIWRNPHAAFLIETGVSGLTAGESAKLDNLDAAISTRLAAAAYVEPDNTGIADAVASAREAADLAAIKLGG